MIILSSWCSKPCMTLFLLCGVLFLQVMVWLWRSLIWNHMITGVDGWCPPQLIMWRSRRTAQSQVRWASPHMFCSSLQKHLILCEVSAVKTLQHNETSSIRPSCSLSGNTTVSYYDRLYSGNERNWSNYSDQGTLIS